MSDRINKIFEKNDKKLVTFVTGGDPNLDCSKKIIKTIAENGADIIEIGMPFSDPMADGPTIQLSSSRAIKEGINLNNIFELCKNFRSFNNEIPIVLMGYYNVVLHYGVKNFVKACKINGVDGLIIVDLQPEEDTDLLLALKSTKIDLIRLITPTTNQKRLSQILKYSSGFLYYVTITGITGQQSANMEKLKQSILKFKKLSNIPIVAGFGIKDEKQVKEVCEFSDGAVVGSSIIKIIENNLENTDKAINLIAEFIKKLKVGIMK